MAPTKDIDNLSKIIDWRKVGSKQMIDIIDIKIGVLKITEQ